jgi:ubiquinone/menaquinone biosynthesis C-methylase UbiE
MIRSMMVRWYRLLWVILLSVTVWSVPAIAFANTPSAPAIATDRSTDGIYEYRDRHDADGIGKFYMGREIAQVMGHRGAAWLERFSREQEEQPMRAIAALELRPNDVVADIGAGTGYFSFRMSPLVPEGKVYAVDVQPEMLELMEFVKKEEQIKNVETILGSATDPNLPANSVDLAILADAYHEFESPRETMEGVVKALKPEGRVVLLEYRKESPWVPIKALHKMSQRQVKKELGAVGLKWQETKKVLPQQHLMIFQKQ